MISQIYVIESRMCLYPFLFWFFVVVVVVVVVFLLMWLSMAPVVSVQMLLIGQLQT
jgi:hypothetical protein